MSTNKPVTELQRPKGKRGGLDGGRAFTWALRPSPCLPRRQRAGRPSGERQLQENGREAPGASVRAWAAVQGGGEHKVQGRWP